MACYYKKSSIIGRRNLETGIYMIDFNKENDNEELEKIIEEEIHPAQKKREAETSFLRDLLGWVFPFAAAIVVAFLIKNYLIINANVPTGSMEYTIIPGDRLIGNRLAYISSGPERGDIIIFHYPDNEEEIYVKRVIGLPGETVRIENAQIFIGDSETPLEETYLKEEWVVATGPYTFEVPEDCYFVLGDNRNDSWDARYWTNTYVSEDKILGKAIFTYWPFRNFGKLE